MTQPQTTRRNFMKITGAAIAVSGLPLFHFRQKAQAEDFVAGSSRNPKKLDTWEDLYRQRWSWDSIAKSSHGWANCRSACAWDVYVKNGIVMREEQTAGEVGKFREEVKNLTVEIAKRPCMEKATL